MLQKLLINSFNFLLPSFCSYCKALLKDNSVFCGTCADKIRPVVSKKISLTATKSMNVFSVGAYTEPLKTLIMAKKWSDVIACKQMARLIEEKTVFSQFPCDVLVPIPLHWSRYYWRGYNQAELIAETLGKKRNIPVSSVLKRIKKTAYQSKLSAQQRLLNIHSAFSLESQKAAQLKNKHVIIIDDLMTTGTTLYEAGRALLPLKPASITAIVVARVV